MEMHEELKQEISACLAKANVTLEQARELSWELQGRLEKFAVSSVAEKTLADANDETDDLAAQILSLFKKYKLTYGQAFSASRWVETGWHSQFIDYTLT